MGANERLWQRYTNNLFLCNRQQTQFYLLMLPEDKSTLGAASWLKTAASEAEAFLPQAIREVAAATDTAIIDMILFMIVFPTAIHEKIGTLLYEVFLGIEYYSVDYFSDLSILPQIISPIFNIFITFAF